MGSSVSQALPQRIQTVPEMLAWWNQQIPDAEALYHKDKGWWEPLTWREYQERSDSIAAGLISIGITSGDHIAILSQTKLEWILADIAIMSCGAVTVPIYQSNTAEQCEYIIGHSECSAIFIEDQEQLDKLLEIWDSVPHVKKAVVFDRYKCNDFRVIPFQDLEKLAEDLESLLKRRENIRQEDTATIVYTSGTTGPPKGVVLSHGNVVFMARQIATSLKLTPDDLSIAYLPMAHIAERMVGSFIKLASGAQTAFAESMDDLIFNMKEVGPTFHFGTPRVYEKFHSKITSAIDDATRFQKVIFSWAEKAGCREKDLRLQHKSLPLYQLLLHSLLDWMALRKVRDFMGGNLNFLVSGGAPISPEILSWMQNMGLNVFEVYGLTESSGLISVNLADDNRLGSVGKVLPDTEMRLAVDGEILTRGDHVCQGYLGDQEATSELISDDGWLSSGDIGKVDEDGYLWITDRKKDLIITAGGKNVAPQNIENLMKTSRYISQFAVFGDRRKYLVGLLTLDEDEITKFARDSRVIYKDLRDLSQQKAVKNCISKEISRLNGELASYETIKTFHILEEDFDQDKDEITPTLKVKRNVIEKRYGHFIEEMYVSN